MYNLSYRDIVSVCQSEGVLSNLCQDRNFWRTLIRTRYPKQSLLAEQIANPRELFRRLSSNYEIQIISREKEPLIYETTKKDLLAGAVLGYKLSSYNINFQAENKLRGTAIRIISPDGRRVQKKEIHDFLAPYRLSAMSRRTVEGYILTERKDVYLVTSYSSTGVVDREYLKDVTKDMLDIAEEIAGYYGMSLVITRYSLGAGGRVIEETRAQDAS
jgi:hypothetical protein